MLNEEKVKLMNRLAIYEKTEGKKYLPVSKYYRSDYIGLALIKNFFMVTIGYILAVGSVALYFGDYLLDNINRVDLIEIGKYLVIGYGIVLLLYSALTYIVYSIQYYKAKKSVKKYYEDLTKLEKMYSREEKIPASKWSGGGNRG